MYNQQDEVIDNYYSCVVLYKNHGNQRTHGNSGLNTVNYVELVVTIRYTYRRPGVQRTLKQHPCHE